MGDVSDDDSDGDGKDDGDDKDGKDDKDDKDREAVFGGNDSGAAAAVSRAAAEGCPALKLYL